MRTPRFSPVLLSLMAAVACGTSSTGQGGSAGSTEPNSSSGSGNASSGAGNASSGSGNASSGAGNTSSGSGNASSGAGNASSGSGNTTSGSSGTSSGSSGSDGGGGTIAGETLPGPAFVTSAQGSLWQTATTTTVTSGTATLTVDDGTTFQTFNGFGGAFNEKGWNYLQMLSASDRQKAMTLLFDWTNGAHFVFGRIPIGASDYAMARYTEDDTANDLMMSNFSITEDQKYLIPYAQAALAINPHIELWASPWTPPAWMKENGNSSSSDGFPDDGGTMSNTAQILTAFALYETKWIQAYAGLGITISQLMPQNEPGYAETYPSCLWPAATYDTFVAQYLGPELASQDMSTQIYLGTMSNNVAGTDPAVVSTVTNDATAMKYIKGFAMQWNEISDIPNVTKFNLPIWETEHECGNDPFGGETTVVNVGTQPNTITFNMSAAPNDFDYALESFGLIGNWLKAGVNSYSAWNMVLDTVGLGIDAVRVWPQNALLTVDTGSKTLNITPAYYVFRHFSQFVAPGAVRVATGGSSGLVSYAFKNPDGSHAVIMYNSASSSAQTIASVGGQMVQFTVPANAFATLKT